MPEYIEDFFFYIGIASLSTDFTQAGCPDAPPGDFASKYYAQVPSRCSQHFWHARSIGAFRRSPQSAICDMS